MQLYTEKKFNYKILSIILFIIIICGLFFIYHLYKKSYNTGFQMNANKGAMPVNTIIAKQTDIVKNQEFIAKVVGRKSVDIVARVTGNVSKINFIGGQYVNKGAVLFEIDEAPFLTKIYAPVAGFINISKVENGALIYANSSILTSIVDSEIVYLDAFVPESVLSEISLKNIIEVTDLGLSGSITEIDSALNISTGSAKIRAKVQNAGGVLKPNSFIKIKVLFNPIKGFLVPQNIAIRENDGILTVFIVQDGVAKKVPIYESDIFENNWVITKGLNESDIIISNQIQKVQNGMQVSIN